MASETASNLMLVVATLVLFSVLLDARIGIALSVVALVGFAVYLRRAKA